MKKNDIFTFTAPNGEEATAVILDKQLKRDDCILTIYWYLCYAQNRLFYYIEKYFPDVDKTEYGTGATIADYAILPDYDRMLEDHQHHIDISFCPISCQATPVACRLWATQCTCHPLQDARRAWHQS